MKKDEKLKKKLKKITKKKRNKIKNINHIKKYFIYV